MIIWVLRALFILISGSIGYSVVQLCRMDDVLMGMLVGVLVAVLVTMLEAFFSRRPISSISAIMFGLLIGFVMARFFSEAAFLVLGPNANEWMFGHEIKKVIKDGADVVVETGAPLVTTEDFQAAVSLIMTGIFCYMGISIFYQTRNRFRFIIPYVEFQREERGPRPAVLDTSVIIDGRIADLVDARFLRGPIVIPRFVLAELQGIADSDDRHRRNRGRRGLEVLGRLRRNTDIDVVVRDAYERSDAPVDAQLTDFAKTINGRVVTTDFNLTKIAQIQGVDVLNLNDISNALRPLALPGDELTVELIKPGEEPEQAVAYLDDGTMVVVEHAHERIGTEVKVVVNRLLHTTAGHMIFCRLAE